jgi:hypothetical protein
LRRAHPPHRRLRPQPLSPKGQPPPPFTPSSCRPIEEPGQSGRSPGAKSAGVSCWGRAEVLGGRAPGVSASGQTRVNASTGLSLPVARPPRSTAQAAPGAAVQAGRAGSGGISPLPRRLTRFAAPRREAIPSAARASQVSPLCLRALQSPARCPRSTPGFPTHAPPPAGGHVHSRAQLARADIQHGSPGVR